MSHNGGWTVVGVCVLACAWGFEDRPTARLGEGPVEAVRQAGDESAGVRRELNCQIVDLGDTKSQAPTEPTRKQTPHDFGTQPAGRGGAAGGPELIDLSGWVALQFTCVPSSGGAANWVLSDSNHTVTQTRNSDPAIYLSDFALQNTEIRGTWRVNDSGDDDYIGFVFGYQDRGHFYHFDWKRGNQGCGLRGMTMRIVNVMGQGDPTCEDLECTQDSENVTILRHDATHAWAPFTDYGFLLRFVPGAFHIEVTHGATVLAAWDFEDSTYSSGNFGFYNASQESVVYRGFTQEVLPLPDLLPARIEPVGFGGDWQALRVEGAVSVEVQNIGPGNAGPTDAVLFEDLNFNSQFELGADRVLGIADVPALSSGGVTSVSIGVASDVLYRDNVVFAFVDSGRRVLESDERNNHGRGGIRCAAGIRTTRTFTADSDFDEGVLSNVNHDTPGQLQLNPIITAAYPFINIAATGRGTIVRIDINATDPTRAIIGEYRCAPHPTGQPGSQFARNPSRTTVDRDGNVWCGDRVLGSPTSIVKVGVVLGGTRGNKNPDGSFTPDPNGEYLAPPFTYSTAVDRDGDGLIRTSRGRGHVLLWPNRTDWDGAPDGVPALVEDAEDECILVFQRLPGTNTSRHVSVSPTNDIWVGGLPTSNFWRLDSESGARIQSFSNAALGCGGYGGLIDGENVLWSATANCASCNLLRFDLTTMTGVCLASPYSYGLAIDSNGYVWNARYSAHSVRKFAPNGDCVSCPNDYTIGGYRGARGLAASPIDNNIWVAASESQRLVRLSNEGGFRKAISVGSDPTGVAVDANGKVWVTNNGSGTVMRIDPSAGSDGLGAVDLTVVVGEGDQRSVYNYSDMTGSGFLLSNPSGTWTVVHDGGVPGVNWDRCNWTSEEPSGTSVTVRVRTAEERGQLQGQAWQLISNGEALAPRDLTGRFIEIEVRFSRPAGSELIPVLHDLTIAGAPDLTASFIQFSCDTSPRYVSCRVGNGGARTVDAGVPVSFYDGDPSVDGTLLGTGYTLFPLLPGLFEDVRIELPASFDCTRRLWVVADDSGGAPEGPGVNAIFDNEGDFVALTGAAPTDPLPNLGLVSTPWQFGSLSFSFLPPSNALTVGSGGDDDWSQLLPGNQLGLSGQEFLVITSQSPLKSFGFYLHEPGDNIVCSAGSPANCPCVPSTYRVRAKSGTQIVAEHTFEPDRDVAVFVGLASEVGFDRVEIEEIVGTCDNEYFGPFLFGSHGVRISSTIDECDETNNIHSAQAESILDSLVDVTLGVQIDFRNTSYNRQEQVLIVDATAENIGADPITGCLMLVIEMRETGASVVNPDGFTPDGKPYFAFLSPLSQPAVLNPGETTAPKRMIFRTRQSTPSFHMSWRSCANRAPFFTSFPATSAIAGQEYRYQAVALDPDNQPLTYSVAGGPLSEAAFTIDAATGLVSWTPTANDIGNHTVTLKVEDGVGGSATQRYSIQVSTAAVNRPPIISTAPTTRVSVGASYEYLATAVDPDGDAVTFTKLDGPAELTVDPAGRVFWEFALPGAYPVGIRAEDGRGGYAEQSWLLTAGSVSGNPHAPSLFGTPAAVGAVGALYFYQPAANDADGDPLTFSLPEAPAGMTINATTGRVEWTPTATGRARVRLVVSDGNGGSASQAWDIDVSDRLPNRPPVVVSVPNFVAIINTPYEYQVLATDPEGASLNYELVAAPAEMTIDRTSGRITWLPPAAGTVTVAIKATDPLNAFGSQVYDLVVSPPNTDPVLDAIPNQVVSVGAVFRYDVNASDAEGHTLRYSLRTAPAAMTINAQNGLIRWPTTPADLGAHDVEVVVGDAYGGLDAQAFVVTVEQDTTLPTLVITTEPNPASINNLARVCVQAADNVGVVNRTLFIDGEERPLNAAGCYEFTPTVAGVLQITARATDAAGNEGTATAQLRVGDPADQGVPTVLLTSPDPGPSLTVTATMPFDLRATITDDADPETWLGWEVRLARGEQDGPYTVLSSGTDEIIDGYVGTLDPTLLANDTYWVVLFADDINHQVTQPVLRVFVEGDYKPGRFTLTFTDMEVPVLGIPLTVSRRYDSHELESGDFGHGWTLAFPGKVTDEPAESPGLEPMTNGSKVQITRPDGRRVGFRVFAVPISFFFPFIAELRFIPDSGSNDELSTPGGNIVFIFGGELYSNFGDVFNPRTYILKTRTQITYVIDEQDGLRSIEDANGNRVTVTPGGLLSDTGLGITLVRDAQGRITRAIEPDNDPGDGIPARFVRYEYDAPGNLVSVFDQGDHETTLMYDDARFPHYLTEVIDPLGRRGVRNEYDDEGRLTASVDAEGQRIEYTRDIDARREEITDREGHPTVLYYDERGNVIRRTDAYGQDTIYEYNDDSKLVREEDCAGRVKTWTYNDAGDVLTETNCSGGETVYTRDARGNPLTKRDALGNLWSYVYDADGNLLQETAPDGGITVHTYYPGTGLRHTTTNPLLDVEYFEYDSYGRMSVHVDFSGARTEYAYNATGDKIRETKFRTPPGGGDLEPVITQYRHDANHREIEMIDALNGRTTKQYDAAGQLRFVTDPLLRTTENRYDVLGNLDEVHYPDGTYEGYTYDHEGRRTSVRNRDGHVTTYRYDRLGRLVKTIHPDLTPESEDDNPFTEVGYDCVGRIEHQWDERRNNTGYAYSCQPNQQIVTDALGHTTVHTFDLLGQRTHMLDANLHETEYVYDGLGRQIRTIYHDGSFSETRYDLAGRKERDIDQADKITRYEHDEMGRLTAVFLRDGDREVPTRYAYDELGNQVTQMDARGRITRFEYDKLSRRTKRILPLGQQELMTYDAAGQLGTKRDFNGDTIDYDYDLAGRLQRETTPDGGYYEYAYNGIGKRTLERIVVPGQPPQDTVKQYDVRGRLTHVANPDGSSIAYGYDAAGNRTLLVTTTPQITQTTTFDFDALNRLWRVHHPDNGGVSTYAYDLVGNRQSLTLPNATVATYQYDALNRLTVLTNSRSDNSIISRYAYTLSPSGQRTRVDETTPNGNARVVIYTYDDMYRLTGEQITDPEHENLNITYTYDDVGNRLTKRLIAPGGTLLTDYDYDANDRLLTETETQQLARARERLIDSYVASGMPVPSAALYHGSHGFYVVSALPLLWLGLLFAPRPRSVGRARWRRRIRTQTIALVLLPLLLLTPETVARAYGAGRAHAEYGAALATAGLTETVTTYTYDDNGNTLTRERGELTDTYGWDFRNRLVNAVNQTQDGSSTTFAYDVDGIRVSKVITGVSAVEYVVDKNRDYAQVLTELTDPAGPPSPVGITYVYGDDLLTMTRPETETSFYHFDGQLSTRQLSTIVQGVTAQYAYEAFGSVIGAFGNVINPYRFRGEQHDANLNLTYLRARYYEPAAGRFTSRDEFGGRLCDPRSLHKYTYAHANPVFYADPSGHAATIGFLVVLAVVSVLLLLLAGAADALRGCSEEALNAAPDRPDTFDGQFGGHRDFMRHCTWFCCASRRSPFAAVYLLGALLFELIHPVEAWENIQRPDLLWYDITCSDVQGIRARSDRDGNGNWISCESACSSRASRCVSDPSQGYDQFPPPWWE